MNRDLIFILPPLTFSEVYGELGSPRAEYERIQPYDGVIFWFFSVRIIRRPAGGQKAASAPIGGKLTVRAAGTVKRLALI